VKRPHYDGRADSWREVYRSPDPFGQKIRRRRDAVVAAVERTLGERRALILDAGCGTGEVARRLEELGHTVVGVELSQEMLKEALNSPPPAGRRPFYVRGSIANLPLHPCSFDVVVCVGVLGHLPRLRLPDRMLDAESDAMRELVRVLRPGGFLVLTTTSLLRLHWLLDPVQLRRALRQRRRGQEHEKRLMLPGGGPDSSNRSLEPNWTRRRTPGEMREFLSRHGLDILEWTGIGFGPFTFLGRQILSFDRSVRLSASLERMAQLPGLRPLGRLAGTWVLTLAPRLLRREHAQSSSGAGDFRP